MARRRRLGEREIAAYARQAVDEVTGAEDVDSAAQQVLNQAPDREMRQAVVETSVGAPDRVTAAFVGAALRSGDDEVARVAADLLLDTSRSPAALQLLQQCFASDDATVRCRAVEALENFSNPEAVPIFPAALTDQADSVRRAATTALGLVIGTRQHGLRDAILNELADPEGALARAIIANEDQQVRRQATQGLAFVDSDVALPTIGKLCADKDAGVRQEAILCLAGIGTQQAIALMGAQLGDPDYHVAAVVLDMLAARLGGASTAFLEYLRKAVAHPVVELRRHAVLMLDRFDPDQALPVLQKAAADSDFEVARRAGEMLRKLPGELELGWLAREMESQAAGEKALTVWEAGNIGMEAGTGTPSAPGGESAQAQQVIPMLERALVEGSSSDKVHAVNELASLLDIGDSKAMQDALDDGDPSVRSRAAETLSYTRDAGVLAHVVQKHPDPLVRRRAAEALARNPGGPKQRGRITAQVSFSSTRTVGMELFGCFLKALDDPDTGVRQLACAAIREYAQNAPLCPVRGTVDKLEDLAGDEQVSFLMREDADDAAEAVRKISMGRLIAGAVNDVLEWRGQVAREAHAVRWDQEAGLYFVDCAAAPDAVERWSAQYGLPEEQVEKLRQAARTGQGAGGLDPQAAGRILHGLARDLSSALDCVTHGARAVMLIGQEGLEGDLEGWAAAVQTGPELDWGRSETVQKLQRRLYRLRKRAWIEATGARESFADAPSPGFLDEPAEDQDDWVKLTAAGARAEREEWREPTDASAGAALDGVRRLCQAHVGDEEYCEPIGRCAVSLLRAGLQEGAGLAEFALGAARVDFRMELTQQLMVAAQGEEAASVLFDHISPKTLDNVPALCVALALRGAGKSLQTPERAQAAEDTDLTCALLALRAMQQDPDAAQELEELLRNGRPLERHCGAHYLALARVRSAVPTLASVRDQDVPYALKGLCGASLLRGGHAGSAGWFERSLKRASGSVKAGLLMHLCRAVEDVIPLMIECKDVNVGRFV